jgi:hypothetical protein
VDGKFWEYLGTADPIKGKMFYDSVVLASAQFLSITNIRRSRSNIVLISKRILPAKSTD